MGTTYMDFSTGVFHVDGDAPLTQEQVDSVWRHLPTTGASWVERGNLFVQQFDGAKAFNLGPVERGVKGASDKARFRGPSKHHHATKKSPAQLDREIAEALGRFPHDEPELQAKYRVEPSELRVGQRFDYFGQIFEIIKIGRDKAKTIQIARRYTTPSGREDLLDHRSFPMRAFYQQHLRPLRD